MDVYLRLLLIAVVITPSTCSGYVECPTSVWSQVDSEPHEPECENYELEYINLSEGNAHLVNILEDDNNYDDRDFSWYKNGTEIKSITNHSNQSVHYHGAVLYLLNISAENAGFYFVRYKGSESCDTYCIQINVFKNKLADKLIFAIINNTDVDKGLECPLPIKWTCEHFAGRLTWEKSTPGQPKILPGENKAVLSIRQATKDAGGIYTCTCTWKYNQKEYKSSGTVTLVHREPIAHRVPEILSPMDTEVFAYEGYEIKMNCSVQCGINVQEECKASWHVNRNPIIQKDGYSIITKTFTVQPSLITISSAVLTINKVSPEDFKEYVCIGDGYYKLANRTVTLKRRETITPLIIGGLCVSFFFLFAAALVKYFAIDLALLFRPYIPLRSRKEDAKMYDAYVIYQMHSKDKATEDALCQFVTNYLPTVLEEKCGYRLFIRGRDDTPGEDHLELVENCMKLSKRLMVILTPGSVLGSEISDQVPASPQAALIGGFDWQVGLHHALVQREMSVILIQLGDIGPEGYSHLPPGLQHLIRKSAPIRWPKDSRAAAAKNTRFWKRVRYLMPAIPVQRCSQGVVI